MCQRANTGESYIFYLGYLYAVDLNCMSNTVPVRLGIQNRPTAPLIEKSRASMSGR